MARLKKTWIEKNAEYLKNNIIKCFLRIPEVLSKESLNNFLDTQFGLMCKDLFSALRFLSPFMVDYRDDNDNYEFKLSNFEEKLLKRFLIEQHHLTKAESKIAVDRSSGMVNIRITIVDIIGALLWEEDLKDFRNSFKILLPKEIAVPFFKAAPKSEYLDFYLEEATLASYILVKEFPLNPIEWLSFFESAKSTILRSISMDESSFNDLTNLIKSCFTTKEKK
jgi:hypothetical protein